MISEIMKEWRGKIKGGVVHSFTGTIEEMEQILALDLFIGMRPHHHSLVK